MIIRSPQNVAAEKISTMQKIVESLGFEVTVEDDPHEEWLSIKDVAARLRISPDSIRRRISSGDIHSRKLSNSKNGAVRIRWSSVLEWLESCEHNIKGEKNDCH